MVDDGAFPAISEDTLLFLGGIMGIAPGFRDCKGQGHSMVEASEVLREEPDYDANAEFIERELFVPENRD